MQSLKETLTPEQTKLIQRFTKGLNIDQHTGDPSMNIVIKGNYLDRLGLIDDLIQVSRVALLNELLQPEQVAPSVANILKLATALMPFSEMEMLNELNGI